MFDIGADELLLTAVVAIVVIGPKDMPRALRTAGRWIAKMRRMSSSFRAGIENVIREAELEEMEAEWRKQNAAIMANHPPDAAQADALAAAAAAQGDPAALPPPVDVAAEPLAVAEDQPEAADAPAPEPAPEPERVAPLPPADAGSATPVRRTPGRPD